MKKTLSLALSACMLLGLAGCSSPGGSAAGTAELPATDADFVLTLAEDAAPLDGEGRRVAFATNSAGVQTGRDAMIWRGVNTFCDSFNYTAQSFAPEEDAELPAESALRKAAESGAELVVCAGEDMAAALYKIQDNYPSVSYLLLDAEPHSEDFAVYSTSDNVFCALFQEEQAGYLAGYAAVMQGSTRLGVLGADPLPGNVRYVTGFLQGAEGAAEQQGVQVEVTVWYSELDEANDALAAEVAQWIAGGTQLVFAVGQAMAENCLAAVRTAGSGQVITIDTDRTYEAEEILTAAAKNYSTVTQKQLYAFFANDARWGVDAAGQTGRFGVAADAVGLPTQRWRFGQSFDLEEYAALYQGLRSSSIQVERISDAATLPETPNLAVTVKNN